LHEQLAQERNTAATVSNELVQFQAELTTSRERLEAQLKQKDDDIASLRADAAGQSEQLSNRIDELQLQLAEKQLLAESRVTELERLRTSVTQLNEQLSEKAAIHAQALGLWQDSQAQHSTVIAQLTAARDELLYSQTALEVELDQARSASAGLRGELQESRNRVAELDALLESSQTAMADVAADRARLHSELERLDALHHQTKADAARDLAQGRDALESDLSALRNELQQKSWSLAQHQASVDNLAQIHREQMRKLEGRLSEQQPVLEQQSRELEQAVSRANALQRQVDELRAALQQTQAAGATQAEQIRQEYAARLETVNSLLAIKSAEMANSGAVRANIEESLRGELSHLRGEIQSRTAALQSREDELNRVREEMTSVQNRIVQLESVSARSESEAREIAQAKSSLESELTALRDELQQGSSAVSHQQAAMDDLAARHRSQVEQLEANLSEQHRASEERRREVDQAQAQIALLHSRIEELQSALEQSELSANSRTEQLRQEYATHVDALNRKLSEDSAQLQDRASANSDSEQALRSEIDRLIGDAQERNQILESRNDELVRIKNDLDSLAERFSQLESHAARAASSASGEAETMRAEFQAQLALLQAELSQKEWALEERQAIVAGLEQEHRQQLEALRQQIVEKEQSAAPADDAFVMGDPNLTDAQRVKLHKLDDLAKAIRSGNGASFPVASGRRWQSGFGWKRRWRS
jgi:ParB family chromosome partitioning protein